MSDASKDAEAAARLIVRNDKSLDTPKKIALCLEMVGRMKWQFGWGNIPCTKSGTTVNELIKKVATGSAK